MVSKLNQIYGEIDNINSFIHPEYNEKFSFITNKKLNFLAQKISKKIVKSEYNQVLVIESGASPFSRLCEPIVARKKKVRWIYVKFPRDSVKNIFPVFDYYLSKKEKTENLSKEQIDSIKSILKISKNLGNKREKVLKKICSEMPQSFLYPKKQSLNKILQEISKRSRNKYQKVISIIFEDTGISNFLKKPFLLFDEYIDSGTTLNNYQHYLNFICKTDFRIISYQVMIKKSNKYPSIYFTLYDLGSQLNCYRLGVYPFENRIDLIGYFYYLDQNSFEKIKLDNLIKNDGKITGRFIEEIAKGVVNSGIVQKIKREFKIKPVRDFIDENHLLRYLLFVLEKEVSRYGKEAEFLWLAFDMYGPIWSPLPDKYHLEFMEVFEKEYKEFTRMKDFSKLKKKYKTFRKEIISGISSIMIERRKKWLKSIKPILKNGN